MLAEPFGHIADSLRHAGSVVDTLLLHPRIDQMAGLTLGGALVSILLGIIASIIAGVIVGKWFEHRSTKVLELFTRRIVGETTLAITDAVSRLSQHTREIPVMAGSISKLGPLIEKLCSAVERGMKPK
jgi:uncharacterized membrane protein YeaQ/YmgE (transglycosylase-associated protein family)